MGSAAPLSPVLTFAVSDDVLSLVVLESSLTPVSVDVSSEEVTSETVDEVFDGVLDVTCEEDEGWEDDVLAGV